MNANFLFRISIFQLLLVAVLAAMPARAAITVVDYWRMGENDPGAVLGGSCTNLTDAVGGRTLTNLPVYPTYTNATSSSTATNTGSLLALQLNGAQSAAGNVIPSLTDNFGIELWAKAANTTAGTKVLAYNGNTSLSGAGIFQSGGIYEVVIGGLVIFGSATVTPNVWTHLALVRDSGTTTLYINGVPAGSNTATPAAPAGNFLIGANNLHGENFAGALDEVRVFTFGAGAFSLTNLLYYQAPVYTLSSSNFPESAVGGSASFTFSVVPTNVSWTATANVSWLHVTNSSSTGSNTINFSFDDNPGGSRGGVITIAGQTVSVSEGSPSYSLDGANYSGYWSGDVLEESSGAGSDSIGLTVTPNAGTWSVSSTVGWIHPTNPSGAGSTNISFTFDANTDPAGGARAGQVYINNPSNPLLPRFVVFQQAPASGTGQATYRFTGNLIPYLPQYVPANASAALKSVQSNDVFYLTMTLVPSTVNIYYETWPCAVNYITFSVPSRGLVYTKSFDDLEVLDDGSNPDTLRWDDDNVDSTVAMIFWARDFNETALPNGAVPNPLNLTGFHANGFAQIILFDNEGGNPTLFTGNLLPIPPLSLRQKQHTNTISWATSDATYTNTLQTSFSLGPNAVWQNVTNVPTALGLTNTLTLPATNSGAQFFRLQIL